MGCGAGVQGKSTNSVEPSKNIRELAPLAKPPPFKAKSVLEAVRIFQLVDKDSNGNLSRAELSTVCQSMEYAKKLMDSLDNDNSNTLNLDEWLAYLSQLATFSPEHVDAVMNAYRQQICENEIIKQKGLKQEEIPGTWPLQTEAVRIFRLADKDVNGCLDKAELITVCQNTEYAEWVLENLDSDDSKTLTLDEWFGYVKGLAEKSLPTADAVLQSYETHLYGKKNLDLQEKHASGNWPLRPEAVRVFDLADKNSNGSLEMNELAQVCESLEHAQWVMDIADKDLSGAMSLDEWFAYVKCLANQSQQAALAVLEAYEQQLHEKPEVMSL